MTVILTRNWWALAIRGLAGIIFGILTFLWPGISLAALVLLFGAYAITDGIFAIVAALSGPGSKGKWWALLIGGIVSIAAGVLAFILPGLTALALLFLIAGWAIATGVFAIVTAIRLRKEIRGEWMMILFGLVSVAFGIMLALFPGAGALAVVLWIGAYALVTGALLLGLAIRLRGVERRLTRGTHGEPRTV
jgi:uncharacterized membrane protein HdeD (DUF308 family)